MKKKITILTMHAGFGGIERFVATLADMLSRDYAVTIVANYGQPGHEAFVYPKNVAVKYLSPKLPDMVSFKGLIRKKNPSTIVRELERRRKINSERQHVLKEALAEIDTDIIITDRAQYSAAVKKHCHKPNILKIATDHNYHQNNKGYIRELVSSVNGFDYLVLPTKELRDFYKDKVRNAKCVYIPHPLDKIPSKKTSFAKRNLVSAGRLSPEKGFLDLIEIMGKVHKKLPQTKLFLLGDGPEKPAITAKIKQLGLEKVVIMPGFVRHEDIAPYFYDSSLFIMTSHTEAFGLVLAEAMSYGLPCVTFDSASGARAQITSDNGVLIKNRNKDQMAHAITDLLKNRATLEKYQKHIIRHISAFSKSTVLKNWKKILQA